MSRKKTDWLQALLLVSVATFGILFLVITTSSDFDEPRAAPSRAASSAEQVGHSVGSRSKGFVRGFVDGWKSRPTQGHDHNHKKEGP